MDVMGEACSIGSEVVELRQSLAIVTEALILFQEYIETEIGEMSYFRDSGSYNKLVETFNRLRPRNDNRTPVRIQAPPPPPMYHYQYHQQPMEYKPNFHMDGLMMISQACDEEIKNHQFIPAPVIAPAMQQVLSQGEDEQVDVNVDSNEEDGTAGRIMINQVFSVTPPPPPSFVNDGDLEAPTVATIQQESPNVCEPINLSGGQPSVIVSKNQLMIQSQNQPMITAAAPPFPHVANEREVPPMGLRKTPSLNRDGLPRARKPSKHSVKKALKKMKNKGVIMNGVGAITMNNAEIKTKGGLNRKSRKFLDKPVKCPECSKSYSSRGVMSRHMKEVHQLEPQFTCFYCPLKFRNGPIRLEHMTSVHPDDMSSITCPYCKRRSQSVAGKRNHMMLCAKKCNSPDGKAVG
ncbi:unnamed protein product [Orchesella dallaii]|uniref:C2H2-type domain-containing protein n=1 Tax=Orchesella dallaii TaxID=48710 RepID=A0ABP1PU53_9HEXA